MPSAATRFGCQQHDKKYFEYYYNLLWGEKPVAGSSDSAGPGSEACENCSESDCDGGCCSGDGPEPGAREADSGSASSCSNCGRSECTGCDGASSRGVVRDGSESEEVALEPSSGCSLDQYCDADYCGTENSLDWDYDQLFIEQLNDVITDVESSNNWGTVPGGARELILASRTPRLDYRRVLRAFRATVLSSDRRLTRMKPSRRYGFQYMGSRRDFTTRLLFAVDVSGSVSTKDVENAFSIVNRLFKYGIESIDVIWFDTAVRNEDQKPLELKRARESIEVGGRGGTNFQPLMNYLDVHRDYDGLIVFTDGIAPVPERPKRNRRTRVVWLFNHEENWQRLHEGLEHPGMSTAFVTAGLMAARRLSFDEPGHPVNNVSNFVFVTHFNICGVEARRSCSCRICRSASTTPLQTMQVASAVSTW